MKSIFLSLLFILALALAGCGGQAIKPAGTVSMAATDWYQRWSTNMPIHPTPEAQGWYFDFPNAQGEVAYVNTPYTEVMTGKTVSATFEVVSANPNYGLWSANTYGPPSLHLELQRAGDDWQAGPQTQYYRWWCGSGAYVLGSGDNQIVTVSCPLTPDAWVSVLGAQDAAEFQAALDNVQWVGFTFGASGGWGHGVNVTQGSARFELLDFRIS